VWPLTIEEAKEPRLNSLALFVAWYNFRRKNEALKVIPLCLFIPY
jgi:hypothetical protein